VFSRNERNNLEDISVDGRVILYLVFLKNRVEICGND
jgi:hypothetical protein